MACSLKPLECSPFTIQRHRISFANKQQVLFENRLQRAVSSVKTSTVRQLVPIGCFQIQFSPRNFDGSSRSACDTVNAFVLCTTVSWRKFSVDYEPNLVISLSAAVRMVPLVGRTDVQPNLVLRQMSVLLPPPPGESESSG